jgi:hypothetical protein
MKKQLPEQITALFSEEQTRQILARASELDRLLSGQLSASAIREAAIEAGINETAVEQAILEARSGARFPVSLAQTPDGPGWRSWVRLAMAIGVGGSMGFTARVIQPARFGSDAGESTLIITLCLIALSAAVASKDQGPKAPLRYQITNVLLWVSFAVGWSFLPERIYQGSADGIEMAIAGGVASALIGAGIKWWRNSRWSSGEPRASASADAEPLQAM